MCRQIPNILTTIRIVCSILLLICKPLSVTFVWLYVAAGVSDMLDGFTARQFDAVTVFGEKYDSLADIIFVGVCLLKLLPAFHLQLWSVVWIGLIAAIKMLTLLFSYACHRNKLFFTYNCKQSYRRYALPYSTYSYMDSYKPCTSCCMCSSNLCGDTGRTFDQERKNTNSR